MIHDRGNIKWGTSFMQPEHLKMLNKLDAEENNVKKPILDDQQLYEMNALIHIALKDDLTIHVKYFKDNSYLFQKGKIIFIESIKGFLRLNNDEKHEIPINDIVEVTII